MKQLLSDGRTLMASLADVKTFFAENGICGKTIQDLRPAAYDYIIQNLDEIDDIAKKQACCAITTDWQICILFTDGTHIEVELPGSAPIILGYNTADFSKYPQYDGSCYRLNTMFRDCIGKKIADIAIIQDAEKMLFPRYRGIDMSGDDDGIFEIRFILDDGSYLAATGVVDWFNFTYYTRRGQYANVPFSELLKELKIN